MSRVPSFCLPSIASSSSLSHFRLSLPCIRSHLGHWNCSRIYHWRLPFPSCRTNPFTFRRFDVPQGVSLFPPLRSLWVHFDMRSKQTLSISLALDDEADSTSFDASTVDLRLHLPRGDARENFRHPTSILLLVDGKLRVSGAPSLTSNTPVFVLECSLPSTSSSKLVEHLDRRRKTRRGRMVVLGTSEASSRQESSLEYILDVHDSR